MSAIVAINVTVSVLCYFFPVGCYDHFDDSHLFIFYIEFAPPQFDRLQSGGWRSGKTGQILETDVRHHAPLRCDHRVGAPWRPAAEQPAPRPRVRLGVADACRQHEAVARHYSDATVRFSRGHRARVRQDVRATVQ